jgi:hypothetical protein
VVDYWYLVVPFVGAGVIIADCLAVFVSRSSAQRLTFLALLTVPPIVLAVSSYLFPYHEVLVLMNELG